MPLWAAGRIGMRRSPSSRTPRSRVARTGTSIRSRSPFDRQRHTPLARTAHYLHVGNSDSRRGRRTRTDVESIGSSCLRCTSRFSRRRSVFATIRSRRQIRIPVREHGTVGSRVGPGAPSLEPCCREASSSRLARALAGSSCRVYCRSEPRPLRDSIARQACGLPLLALHGNSRSRNGA